MAQTTNPRGREPETGNGRLEICWCLHGGCVRQKVLLRCGAVRFAYGHPEAAVAGRPRESLRYLTLFSCVKFSFFSFALFSLTPFSPIFYLSSLNSFLPNSFGRHPGGSRGTAPPAQAGGTGNPVPGDYELAQSLRAISPAGLVDGILPLRIGLQGVRTLNGEGDRSTASPPSLQSFQ